MKVFVAASYSSKVNYDTGEVFSEYKEWLEGVLTFIAKDELVYFNAAMPKAGVVRDTELPLDKQQLNKLLG